MTDLAGQKKRFFALAATTALAISSAAPLTAGNIHRSPGAHGGEQTSSRAVFKRPSRAELDRIGVDFVESKLLAGTSLRVNEFRLKKNGLSILLAERHITPMAAGMIVYRVGSRNEAVGYTGATHFLEHMMFKGTKRHDPLKGTGIDDLLKPVGGYNNASTSTDSTNYVMTFPSDKLDLWLDLDSDRMRNLLLRKSDHDSEMTVVRNELERGEDEPAALLQVNMFANAFREHPYHHPTIGWRSDVEHVPLSRLRQFYDQFYWPNNATIIAIGDFSTMHALERIAHYFGSIPRSPHPFPSVYTKEPPQEGERRFVVQRGTEQPRVVIGYHVPDARDKDAYALDILSAILGDDSKPSTRLYKIVEAGLASEIDGSNITLRDPGLFLLSATATPSGKPEQLEESLLSEIQKLKNEPISSEEIVRAKKTLIKRLKLSFSEPMSIGDQLAEATAVADWVWLSRYPQGINNVTPADLKRVANAVFTERNKTVGYYLPKTILASSHLTTTNVSGATASANQGAGSPNSRGEHLPSSDNANVLRTPGLSGSDRTQKQHDGSAPAGEGVLLASSAELSPKTDSAAATATAGSNVDSPGKDEASATTTLEEKNHVSRPKSSTSQIASASLCEPGRISFAQRTKRFQLGNGLTLLVVPIPGTGTVALSGRVRAGNYFTDVNKGQIPVLLAELLTKGSNRLSKEALAAKLEELGVSLSYGCDNFWISFNTEVASEDISTLMPLVADTLRNPLLNEQELERAKGIRASLIKDKMADTAELAWNSFVRTFYKPTCVYYDKTLELQKSELASITADDLKHFHQQYVSAPNTVLVLVGDIQLDQARALVEQNFGSWSGGQRSDIKIDASDVLQISQAKAITTNVSDKANADAIIGHPIEVSVGAKDYFPTVIGNAALGYDSFACRLAPVRDKFGLSYSISSSFSPEYPWAPWTVSFSTNPENCQKAISIVNKIVADYIKTGITAAEVAGEKSHLAGAFYVALRGPKQIAAKLCELEALGVGPRYLDTFADNLNRVTQAQVNTAIRKYFQLNRSVTSVGGSLTTSGK